MVGLLLVAAVSAAQATVDKDESSGVQSLLNEESADVFLAKATLQQYLSRVVRKDWEGAKRLTHPKTMGVVSQLKKRATHNLAPWASVEQVQLKTFRFAGAKQVAPGVVAIEVGEDAYHAEEQGMSTDEAAIYYLFKSRGGFLVGDKKDGMELAEVTESAVRSGYQGYADPQAQAQARREAAIHHGRHR